ncbi:methyl-accepting chemotaxis protein [Roseateles sp. SL47]|uniref:methyl-accepting chemotaxis protein n=1 Tax=Roseateles sp. SL47 TaxID=2995138 RepID=UPI002D1E422B|nr:methyl-accepting chemotaxis protein [Roseateles sp. SL47]
MSLVRNLKIGRRLGLAFLVMVVLMGVMAAVARLGLATVGDHLAAVLKDRYVKVRQVQSIFDELNLQARSARNMLLLETSEERANETGSIQGSRQRALDVYDAMVPTITDPDAKATLDAVMGIRKEYGASLENFLRLAAAQDTDRARAELLTKLRPAQLAYVAKLTKLVERQEVLMAEAGAQASAAVDRTLWLLLATLVVGGGVGLVFGFVATRSVTQPLAEVQRTMESVAGGDLSLEVTVDRGDELGDLQRSLSRMVTGLRGLVREVRSGVDSVTTASTQIAMGNLDLSSRTEQQASSLEETASAMEQMNGTVRAAADGAREAMVLARSASETAVEGGEAVHRVVSTMDAITASSRRIEDIIGVIDSIAFQTNILALNAAVEAARAGEHGRGFAVVASEVRSLAQRSAGAAREIKSLISASATTVETGGREVAAAGDTMRKIVDQIQRVSSLVAEISGAAQEQSRGIEQINQAVAQMDQVTQQNAALVEESAAAAGSLEHQAKRLADAVASFKLMAAG